MLTAETAPTMNDVIWRVFGKVTRVVPADAEEGISLLRKSVAGNIGGLPEQLELAFGSLRSLVLRQKFRRQRSRIPI